MRIPMLATLLFCTLIFHGKVVHAATPQEVEALQAELALVKMKLKSAEKKLADREGEVSESANPQSPPSKPISDLSEILKTFPSEAQPDREGNWSNSTLVEAEERLKYAVWGIPFQRKMTIWQINVRENRQAQSDGNASPWLIEVTFQNENCEYEGGTIKQSYKPLKIYAGDAQAKRARKLAKGDVLRVRGHVVTIERVLISSFQSDKPAYAIHLRDVIIPGITK